MNVDPSSDPRVRAIEDNLLAQFALIASSPVVTRDPATDVLAFHSDFPLAMFNFIGGARFADVPGRTHALLDDYLARGDDGIPFLWWPTPSTTTPELERILLDRGLETEPSTGMYADLGEPVDPGLPAGLEVDLAPSPEDFGRALADGFGVPEDLGPLLGAMYSVFDPARMLKVVVRDEGTPIASGALFVQGTSAGLYNIAVRASHRRRGVASAITRLLANVGGFHGCTQAVLHATDESLPVYRACGFDEVCAMPQYSWYPR